MKRVVFWLGFCLLSLAVVLSRVFSSCSSCGVLVYDLNPDTPNGQTTGLDASSTAGLTLRVDGRADYLYAVSLNAGVYRSIPGLYNAGWVQLNASPPHAYSLAVDPNDVHHIAVGERDGDNADPRTNKSGVWESQDGGNTWGDYFDPRSLNGTCGSQAIPSVTISTNGTIVAATNCGIAFHPKGGAWAYAQLPQGFPADRVTAVAASPTKVWARDGQYNLVVSDVNAAVFTLATQHPHPAAQVAATGDDGSLAVFDSLAVMICMGQLVDNGKQNLTRLIMYDATQDRWIDQGSVAGAVNGNGNFAIGRRFAKAYTLGQGGRWGSDQQLFVSNAQEVYRATSRNADGTFNFVLVAGTASAGRGSPDPNWRGLLHSDLWDFHLAPDGKAAWIAGDGGVFETLLDGTGWHTRSHTLNTHHVEMLFVPYDGFHLAYATQDNDAWIRTRFGTQAAWDSPGCQGDVNYVAGDAGKGSAALLVRNVGDAVLTGFGAPLPTSHQPLVCGLTFNNDQTFFQSPVAFRFIQTRKGEQYPYPLDAVLLSKLPFTWTDGTGAHAITASGQSFALIRNPNFEASPDVHSQVGTGGWQLAADNLPANPLAFWVTGQSNGPGAHTAPIYYLLASPVGTPTIYRSSGFGQGTQWTPLPNQPGNIVTNGANAREYRNGPLFVNPYDADVMYVLTTTGIVVSHNATQATPTFTPDTTLSNLVSANGTYPFEAGYWGGNGTNVDQATHNGSWTLETLSDMAFDHNDPSHVVAGSAFTGVFVNLGTGTWRNAGQYLPKPLPPVTSVGIVGTDVYVGTLGRGVLRLSSVDEA